MRHRELKGLGVSGPFGTWWHSPFAAEKPSGPGAHAPASALAPQPPCPYTSRSRLLGFWGVGGIRDWVLRLGVKISARIRNPLGR